MQNVGKSICVDCDKDATHAVLNSLEIVSFYVCKYHARMYERDGYFVREMMENEK